MNKDWTQQYVYATINPCTGELELAESDEFGGTNGRLVIMYNLYDMSMVMVFLSYGLFLGPWYLPQNWALAPYVNGP